MRKSFVALISRQGLESFLPETKLACRWSWEVAKRRPATCHWVVMELQVANEVVNLLSAGEDDAALYEMVNGAAFMGPLTGGDEICHRRTAS